jgi:hypothetical protein
MATANLLSNVPNQDRKDLIKQEEHLDLELGDQVKELLETSEAMVAEALMARWEAHLSLEQMHNNSNKHPNS